MDQYIGLIEMESTILDVKVLEGEAGVRELEHVFLRYDSLISFAVFLHIGGRFASAGLWFSRLHLISFRKLFYYII